MKNFLLIHISGYDFTLRDVAGDVVQTYSVAVTGSWEAFEVRFADGTKGVFRTKDWSGVTAV